MVFRQRRTTVKKTRRTTEQIIRILREAEAKRMSTEEVCRTHNLSAQTYYRWKKKYGGMGLKEARRLRELEKENTELKKLLADQLLKGGFAIWNKSNLKVASLFDLKPHELENLKLFASVRNVAMITIYTPQGWASLREVMRGMPNIIDEAQ
jgi:putative transposase